MTARSAPRGDDRAAPHNLDAEQAVLGAMLLSQDAARYAIASGLDAGDFYKPAHQFVYKALNDCVAVDLRPDVILVADELGADGLLETVGGLEYLQQLQAATPAISHVKKYAEIVRKAATMRKLITVAGEIGDIAYSETDDVIGAVGDVEAKILTLIDGIGDSNLPFTDMRAVLAGDLQPVSPALLHRVDGSALIYPLRLNVLQGSPASGKTWVARMLVKEVLDSGGRVMILDFEDTAQALALGLLALGAKPDDIIERVHFLKPDSTTTNAKIVRAIETLGVDLLVIDSVAEALNFCGYSEDKPDEYLRWLSALPRRATAAGSTVLMLDHIVKSKDEQGFWARGTGAKLGACDGATYNVKSTGFNQTTSGHIYMTVAKDRPGGLPAKQGEKAARIWMNPSAGGLVIDASIELPPPEPTQTSKAADADEKLAQVREDLANRCLEVLNRPDAPLSQRKLLSAMRAGKDGLKFSDNKMDPVLIELEDAKAIVRIPTPRGFVYALPPRQQKFPIQGDSE